MSREQIARLIKRPQNTIHPVPIDLNEDKHHLWGETQHPKAGEIAFERIIAGTARHWRTEGNLYVFYDDPALDGPVETLTLNWTPAAGLHTDPAITHRTLEILIDRLSNYRKAAFIIGFAASHPWGGVDLGMKSLLNPFQDSVRAIFDSLSEPGLSVITRWTRALQNIPEDTIDDTLDAPRRAESARRLKSLHAEIEQVRENLPDLPTDDQLIDASDNPEGISN